MFRSIKAIWKLTERKHHCCSPLCTTCEVDVSELTKEAIVRYMDRRIAYLSEHWPKEAQFLKEERQYIQKGCWHDDYEILTQNKEKNR